jgi:flagellar biosynthesis/type III secretory pathway M-ring protein FliF/YscJ
VQRFSVWAGEPAAISQVETKREVLMAEVWAVIVSAILALIVYGIISSKIASRRRKRAREKVLPYVEDTVRPGKRYNVYLSDGRSFPDVELIGTNDPELGQMPIGGWEGMLVLANATGKRIFVRHASVRCVEEV